MPNNDFITIDPVRMQELVESAQHFEADRLSEYDIKVLMAAYKQLDGAIKLVQAAYKQHALDAGLVGNSIDGDHIRVCVYQSGGKYAAEDVSTIDPAFLKVDLDAKAVDAYEKEHGGLPKGVTYKPRALSVRIDLKERADD